MKLDRECFNTMLDEYYKLHGWDSGTGIPLPETLERLGINQEEQSAPRAETSPA
jgi:aldehyde:ferredoxin oxidoreductase